MNSCCVKTVKRLMNKLSNEMKDDCTQVSKGCPGCTQYITVTVKVE